MRVLVACEYSGRVRDAFTAAGHYAMSCDLLPSESPGDHHHGDVFDVIGDGWDLMVAHPPCTALAVSGNRWYSGSDKRAEAVRFVERLWDAPIPLIAIENPVGVLASMSKLGTPSQYIQPWEFGHGETKRTGLWLKGLPPLMATALVSGREQTVWKMPPSEDRAKLRSLTYQGIADAMADQWGQITNREELA